MRIGFVLAELSTGSSLSMWPAVASMFPADGEDTLVVFSGGRLNSPNPLESMRNSIYRFVNPENLEGTIIWSSSLTGHAKSKDVMTAFKSMLAYPLVTIDGKTEDYPEIPDVRFDAYDGSRRIVEHCIEQHNARRIAYIRGPEYHNSAQERFQAFLDTMKAHGIPVDKNLLSDPMPWDAGDDAIKQLLDKRKKIPGKDFDYLLCASDLMLYKASRELIRHGYEIGQDVFVCGFNDSLESRLLETPVTTVRLPYAGLGVNSVLAFRTVAEGKWCGDKVLPTRPMFRRSCGCGPDFNSGRVSEPFGIVEYITEHFPIPLNESRSMVSSVLELPPDVRGYICDVTDEAQVKATLREIEQDFGQSVDILVNNAGIIKRIPMTEMSVEEFRQVIDIDLNAAFIVSKAVLPAMMEKRRGKIINICSMMSELGRETVSAYAAAKGGLKMLTRNICSEFGKYNIQCNGLGPGYIATPQTAPLRERQPDGSRHPFDSFIVAKTPAERWGTTEDLQGPALFLASEASDFVNGQILYVDGGILAYIGRQP